MHQDISMAELLHGEPTMYLQELATKYRSEDADAFRARFRLLQLFPATAPQ
jgi:hypothetical protein